MIINNYVPTIESSENLSAKFFTIADPGFIFDILRNKMYSNTILAICREISCNARDAHREVNTPDLPIVIALPNSLDPNFKIKDFGPGISPERIEHVFIKYAASTKRGDNSQCGAFGIGSKTPFSYSDSFTVVTICDGKKYNYVCFIDETKIGKLALLSEVNTDEKDGTEIIIPVKPADFNAFRDNTISATSHWTVKPILKGAGGNVIYPEYKSIVSGNDWAIIYKNKNDWQRYVKAIIDGIEYPLSVDQLRTYVDGKFIDSLNGSLHLQFNIGELSLSANREQIYFDDATKDKIKNKIGKVYAEVKAIVADKLAQFKSYWEANIFYRQELSSIFADFAHLGTLKWNGLPLIAGYQHVNCAVFNFKKGFFSRKNGNDPNKITRARRQEIHFENDSMLVINDLDMADVTPKHVKDIFTQNPTIKTVQLVCPNDTCTEDHLNKTYHLDKMDPVRLSSFTKASKRRSAAGSRLLLFKFDGGDFKLSSHAAFDDDTNKKVICRVRKREGQDSRYLIYGKNELYFSTVAKIAVKFQDYSFYGVNENVPQDRVNEEFGDDLLFDKFAEENILNTEKEEFVKIKFMDQQRQNMDHRWSNWLNPLKSKIKDPNSLFLKMIDLSISANEINAPIDLIIYELVNGALLPKDLADFGKNNPELNINELNKKCYDKYPVLKILGSYLDENKIPILADYINLIDIQ